MNRQLSLCVLIPFAFACSAGHPRADAGEDAGRDARLDAGVDAGPSLARPPPPGPMVAPDGTGGVTFAIDRLFLGDTDPDGTPDQQNGWEQYGYNIDGIPPAEIAARGCQLLDNASVGTVRAEGPGGLENAFGHLVVPILASIESDTTAQVNTAIAGGTGGTLLFSLGRLGTGASENPIMTQLFQGAAFGSTPRFDGTDQWPVLASSVVDGMTLSSGSPQNATGSYLVQNTWVSGTPATPTITIPLPLFGTPINLNVLHATVSMELNADHTTATRGILSGVISTSELTTDVQLAVGNSDATLCSGEVIDTIVTQIEEASDILLDGTQDSTQSCDGISVGLGFDGAPVQLGAVVPAPTPPPNPCE